MSWRVGQRQGLRERRAGLPNDMRFARTMTYKAKQLEFEAPQKLRDEEVEMLRQTISISPTVVNPLALRERPASEADTVHSPTVVEARKQG